MLVAALQNLVDQATWLPEFVRPSFMVSGYSAGSHMVPLDQYTNFHETLKEHQSPHPPSYLLVYYFKTLL
jgi:hypothetical protein